MGSLGSSPSSKPLIVARTVSPTLAHQDTSDGMKRIDGLCRLASTKSCTHDASMVRLESDTSVARSSVCTWNPSRCCRTAAPTYDWPMPGSPQMTMRGRKTRSCSNAEEEGIKARQLDIAGSRVGGERGAPCMSFSFSNPPPSSTYSASSRTLMRLTSGRTFASAVLACSKEVDRSGTS